MAVSRSQAEYYQKAAEFNEIGWQYFSGWEIERAIGAFEEAAKFDPENPEYHMNLARAHARNGSYPDAMRSLGEYLHVEKDEYLSERYERMFSSAFDDVETRLIAGMKDLNISLQLIGRAIQMWLEYRLMVGRQRLELDSVDEWAGALAYLICRLNFIEFQREEIAAVFGVEPSSLREKSEVLVDRLDLIPADYRYFIGEENPLDKVFEAAQQMNALDQGFEPE